MPLIQKCLDAAVSGPYFEEWEFETLIGYTRDEIAAWPDVDAHDAVNNVLNMLLIYPHGHRLPAPGEEIAMALTRWRGEDTFDGSAKGGFDRLA
ncbi:hypothetical protein ACIBG8_02095 [Nonomuraea sp. NPDC050556]|uniref:hypothetical protein n=1 Tax=Nonomuraea sp. NPDC050556 TaxID=3364369 RepID=UPI00379CCE7B